MVGLIRFIRYGLYGKKTLMLFLLVLASFGITPLLYNNKLLIVSWFMFMFLFLFPKSNVNSSYRPVLTNIGLLAIAYILLIVIYRVVGISTAEMGYCIIPVFFVFPISALLVIDKRFSINNVAFLFHVISLLIALNIADSIRISIMYPLEVAFQNLAEELELQGISKLNIGGSMFVNMTVLYLHIMLIAIYNSKSRKEKYLFGFYIFLTLWFIVMCSFKASVVVLAIVSLIIQYIAHRSHGNFLKSIVLATIVFFFLRLFADDIIDMLVSLSGSDRLASRLSIFSSDSVVDSTAGEATMDARSHLWFVSIESWFKTPFSFLFGIGDHFHGDFINTTASGIGNHSDLLDVLGRYGLIGGFLLYKLLHSYYRYCISTFNFRLKNEIVGFFILLLLMGLTKKIISGEQAITVFMLLPLCLFYISKYDTIKVVK